MKAISLWQPWATLIALGAKRIETRSWSTSHRGPLAIHAAKKIIPAFGQVCHSEPFASALSRSGYDEMECFEFGKIVAIVDLVDCIPTADPVRLFRGCPLTFDAAQEREFGNYDPGRFGWLLKNLRRFPEPIPTKGGQRLWNWDVVWCEGCDGTGLMEGWNRRDGWPCPKCKGMAIVPGLVTV